MMIVASVSTASRSLAVCSRGSLGITTSHDSVPEEGKGHRCFVGEGTAGLGPGAHFSVHVVHLEKRKVNQMFLHHATS